MITQFHPISLCITLHKLVSRIILQRLKPYITEIINPCQVVFVLGRRTSDNIILVREIMHMMVRKTGPKGHMTLKLDLDSSYRKLLSFSKSFQIWLSLLWTWSPQLVFTFCGMDLLYQILSQVGGCIKKIHYLLICLFCVWSNYPFFLKRQFGRKKNPPHDF